MQRYFVEEKGWKINEVLIQGDDVHHISRVMRMNSGAEIIAIHPEKGPALCAIVEIREGGITCSVKEWMDEDRELPVQVTIVASIGKGDKLEQIVQKGTELGATTFIPYQADRSISKWDGKKAPKKIQRLQKIAKEASEQSERAVIPDVLPVQELNELLNMKEDYIHTLFAYANKAREPRSDSLRDALSGIQPGDKVLVVFGPEGGFSEREVEKLKEKDFISIRLGPRIMRMETAPMYFLSSLSYVLEEV